MKGKNDKLSSSIVSILKLFITFTQFMFMNYPPQIIPKQISLIQTKNYPVLNSSTGEDDDKTTINLILITLQYIVLHFQTAN